MRGQQRIAQHLARMLLHQIVHQLNIAQGFRHLVGAHGQETIVDPVIGHGLAAMGANGLRDLVFMVREDQVDTATVNVKGFAQMLRRHCGTLQVPARTTTTPGAVPAGFVICSGLPQHKIARILLVRSHFDTRTGDHVIQRAAGELSIALIGPDGEKHVALGLISETVLDQLARHLDHLRNMLGGMRLDVRHCHTNRAHILAIDFGITGRDRLDRLAAFLGGGDDLVVHIGDVAGIDDLVLTIDMAQGTGEDIKHDGRARIANVRVIINGWTTDIECHTLRVDGFERPFVAAQRVIQGQRGHREIRRGLKNK